MDILCLCCFAILTYAWGLYPVGLFMLARFRGGRVPDGINDKPPVAVILSVLNEERVIERRVQNLVDQNYPHLKMYIGNDGSTDNTADVLARLENVYPSLTVLNCEYNRGKAAVLKELVALSAEPILVFTDANSIFADQTLDTLVDGLLSEGVGACCGKLVFDSLESSTTHENVYWRFENCLKQWESRLDSCLGANGAVYAMRREVFWQELPDNTIVEDFVLAMKVREQGQRVRYLPSAIATEDVPATVQDEWTRRVRIGIGDYQALALCKACMSPAYGLFAWMFLSHKILRWFTPHLVIVMMVTATVCMINAESGPWAYLPPAAWLLIAVAWAGRVLRDLASPLIKPFQILSYFFEMQAALFVGFCRYISGDVTGGWTPTSRNASEHKGGPI